MVAVTVAPQTLGDALTRRRGRMTVRAAIERLTAGNGLKIVSARQRVVTLRQAPAPRHARRARKPMPSPGRSCRRHRRWNPCHQPISS